MSESAAHLDSRIREIRRLRESLTGKGGGGQDPLLAAHLNQINLISAHLSTLGSDPDWAAHVDIDDLKQDQLDIDEHRKHLSGARI